VAGVERAVRVLGIETATWTASVGLVDEGGLEVERTLPVSGSHAVSLLPLIEEVLSAGACRLRDLDIVAVSIGPGSFTGLRIGLSVAKGLALAAGLPLVGVPTLEAYAQSLGVRPGMLCPVLDARKGEVYSATFSWHEKVLRTDWPAAVLRPEALAERVAPPGIVFGDGVDAFEAVFRRRLRSGVEIVSARQRPPRGAVVAALGAARADGGGAGLPVDLEPTYIRAPEAERDQQATG
jgi:tRNA threonylcarbamoyladenosine biosynthesis protein TsaB